MQAMALKDDVRNVVQNFDDMSSDEIVRVLVMILPELRSEHTRAYVSGKIDAVRNVGCEDERKDLCRKLMPYFEWYLQGSQPPSAP